MKYLPALILLLCSLWPHEGHAAGTFVGDVTSTSVAKVIGHGCTTAFYIDTDCDGCGIGVYQSGTFTPVSTPTAGTWPTGYQAVQTPPGQGAAPFYSVSDTIDADDTDPSVCTTADWQAKWGTTNTGMVNFLNQKKNFTNTSRIYYISQAGNDADCAINGLNNPLHPCRTWGQVGNNVFNDNQGGVAIIRGGQLVGSGTVAAQNVAVTCTAPLTKPSCTLSAAWTGPNSSMTSGAAGLAYGFTATDSTGDLLQGCSLTTGSTVFSCQAYGAVHGSPTAAITVNYGVLTVTTAPSPANISVGERIVMVGLPVDTMIVNKGTGSGGNGTYNLASPVLTISNIAATTSFAANWGWSLSFNPCLANFGNVCINPAGSSGHPLYIMNYPGEVVELDRAWTPVAGDSPGKSKNGYLTIDGLKFWSAELGTLSGSTSLAYGKYLTMINTEWSGYYHIEISEWDTATFQHNVFHDMYDHSIYSSFDSCSPTLGPQTASGADFDFNLNFRQSSGSTNCNASYRISAIDNVNYDGNQRGYDAFHFNSWEDTPVITGNIMSYLGGWAIELDVGNYNARISGNLVFDTSSGCFQIFDYQTPGGPGTDRWDDLVNNVCWMGSRTDSIQGKQPGHGFSSGICTSQTSEGCGNLITVSAGWPWVKNLYVVGNVFDTADNTTDTGQTAGYFEPESYPDQTTFQNNILFQSVSSNGDATTTARMFLDPNTNGSLTTGTYSCGGSPPTCTFNTINAGWTGNTYQDPGFVAASEGLLTTPGQFDFGKHNLH